MSIWRRMVVAITGVCAVIVASPCGAETGTLVPRIPDKISEELGPVVAERRIIAVESGGVLITSQGERVRLVGVRPPEGLVDATESFNKRLEDLTLGQNVLLRWSGLKRDRRGRFLAHVVRADRVWIQESLVREGLAVGLPALGETVGEASLLEAEEEARRENLGLWRVPMAGVRPADSISDSEGAFVIVQGTVHRAARAGETVYLNFSADWRRDFTVEIASNRLRDFAAKGINPLDLAGRKVRVRGWLRHHNGPMITLDVPEALEILEPERLQ